MGLHTVLTRHPPRRLVPFPSLALGLRPSGPAFLAFVGFRQVHLNLDCPTQYVIGSPSRRLAWRR